jgi:hypothetical protein
MGFAQRVVESERVGEFFARIGEKLAADWVVFVGFCERCEKRCNGKGQQSAPADFCYPSSFIGCNCCREGGR